MDPNTQKDFFISYTSTDRPWAEWIAWQLEHEGFSVVIQAWDFRPGGNFFYGSAGSGRALPSESRDE